MTDAEIEELKRANANLQEDKDQLIHTVDNLREQCQRESMLVATLRRRMTFTPDVTELHNKLEALEEAFRKNVGIKSGIWGV